MPRKPKASLLGLELVRRLEDVVRDAGNLGIAGPRRGAPIPTPGGLARVTYTFEITDVPGGTYPGTCQKMSRVLAVGETEKDDLARARAAVSNLLDRHKPRKPPP